MNIPVTINQAELNKLPVFKCPPTHHLGSQGNGCAGDPPGYPTYFTQSVYTQHGNSPGKGVQMVILGRVVEHSRDWEGVKDWDEYSVKKQTRLNKLYAPLPIDHPRVRAWIEDKYRHHNNCYQDPEGTGSWSDNLVIWPVPSYKLKHFVDDERFSDEWRTKEKASIKQANNETRAKAKNIAIPENHDAVILIKRHFPDYEPELDLIANPPKVTANWWERLDTKPTPEECPGQYSSEHPVNGSWCQMCGWKAEE